MENALRFPLYSLDMASAGGSGDPPPPPPAPVYDLSSAVESAFAARAAAPPISPAAATALGEDLLRYIKFIEEKKKGNCLEYVTGIHRKLYYVDVDVDDPAFKDFIKDMCENLISKCLVAISQGADLTVKNREGYTLLHLMCKHRQTSAFVSGLISAGADVNAISDSKSRVTPLHLASASMNLNAVSLLLAADANVNATASGGLTPLMMASKKGYLNIVSLLLAARAVNITLKEKFGNTALDLARKNEKAGVVKLLEAKQAEYKNAINRAMNNSTQGKSGSIFGNNNNAPAPPAAAAAAANNGIGAGPPPRRRTSRKELRLSSSRKELRKQRGGMSINSCIGPTCSTTARLRHRTTRKRHRSNRSRKLRR